MRTFVRLLAVGLVLGVLALGLAQAPASDAASTTSKRAYLPSVHKDFTPTPTPTNTPTPSPTPDPSCQPTGQSYSLIPTDGRYQVSNPGSAAPNVSPDLNLTVRGWVDTNAPLGLVNYNGGTDSAAPQLYSLFGDNRTPTFTSAHKVYDWDWTNNRRGNVLNTWPVTLLGMRTSAGEQIKSPSRGGSDIYQGVYYALVVYAEKTRITLHYARNDYVAPGYGIHLEGVCVDPNLLALYNQGNAGGRAQLPALRANQPLGTAIGGELMAAIRDTGTFMDPRSQKDWWQGRSAAYESIGGSVYPVSPDGTVSNEPVPVGATPVPTATPTP